MMGATVLQGGAFRSNVWHRLQVPVMRKERNDCFST
jgi:hypothetical protein